MRLNGLLLTAYPAILGNKLSMLHRSVCQMSNIVTHKSSRYSRHAANLNEVEATLNAIKWDK
jgi:hypothetical protein